MAARVSAIIPVYNGETTIARAIESVLNQQFDEAIELVVTNDCSTDSTARILQEYGERIRVVDQPRRMGMIAARNSAVAAAEGDYLALLDADDAWLPDKTALQVSALDRDPRAVLAYSEHTPIFADGSEWAPTSFEARYDHAPTLEEMLAELWPILPSSVLMRRSVYLGGETFVERARGNLRADWGEDYTLLLARERGEFIYFKEPLARRQMSPGYESIAKWEPDIFLALVQERYGPRAIGLLSQQRQAAADLLAFKASLELQQKQIVRAIKTLAKIPRYDRIYFARPRFLARAGSYGLRTAAKLAGRGKETPQL